jgi:hypothetical protein
MERLNRKVVAALTAGIVAACLIIPARGNTALPDTETYDFVKGKYTSLLDEDRGGCGYYARPEAISQNGEIRELTVLHTAGPSGGTMCNGVFSFKVLRVDCNTAEIPTLTESLLLPTGKRKGLRIKVLPIKSAQVNHHFPSLLHPI